MNSDYLENLLHEVGEAIDSCDPETAEARLLFRLHNMILELYYENERKLVKN